jgi:hypothetical protein
MKKLHKIKQTPKLVKVNNYEIDWHNPIVADTTSEAYDQVKLILEDLGKLTQWEQEGKIEAECGSDSPSFQIITVLDKSIESELQKIGIISRYETEVVEDEEAGVNAEGV